MILQPPQAVADSPPRRELTAVSNPGSSAADRGVNGGPTFEQAEAQIKARGALWQRLDTVGDNGGWKYSCSVPNRQNPTIRRTYEATAGDPVAAVRAVLDQLNQEQ